jgi:hypothetical protein
MFELYFILRMILSGLLLLLFLLVTTAEERPFAAMLTSERFCQKNLRQKIVEKNFK